LRRRSSDNAVVPHKLIRFRGRACGYAA